MTLVEDINTKLIALSEVVTAVDSKLDEVAVFIANLQAAGNGATSEQLQQISDSLTAIQDHATSVLGEADALDSGSPA